MSGGQFETHGAQPQKQAHSVPVFIDRTFTGIYTQRSVLHDPSDLGTLHYYGGRPDALWMGSNVELTNRLTLQRRPGLSQFSTVTWPTAPDRAFSFQLTNGTIQVIVDTTSTGSLTLTSVATSSGSTAVYTGTISGGAANAYVGMVFQITGFTTTSNNGTFTCTASTATTLTLSNANASSESHAAVAVSSGAVYVDNQDGTKTLLFGKGVGAGQAYFVAVAGVLYIGDGVDVRKYTPGNTNGTIWNWGGAAPGSQPSAVITETGASAVAWSASTWFSTMGIIIDANGNGQQLVSVNADTANPNATQIGTSGNGAPNWAAVSPGGTLVDGTVTWTNRGPIAQWKPITGFNGIGGSGGTNTNPATIFDATSSGFYENSKTGGAFATGNSQPPFTGVVGDQHFDASCNWVCYANSLTTPQIFTWQKGHVYSNFLSVFSPNSVIITPIAPPFPTGLFTPPFSTGKSDYLFTSGGGTSNAAAYTPQFSAVAGFPTLDGQLQWVSLGSATWVANTAYKGWQSANNTNFSAVTDPDNNLHVCTQTGTSGSSAPWQAWQANHVYATLVNIIDSNGYIQTVTTAGTSGGAHPAWNTTVGGTTADNTVTWTNQGFAYGFKTTDGTAIWTCVGRATNATWTASQKYYLPSTGFSPPSSGNPFGSAVVVDSNNNVEFVLDTGLSTTPTHPAWNTLTGGYTTDNQILWTNNGPVITNSRAWTTGFVYAYSFKARSLTDFYSVNVPGTNLPPVPPGSNPPIPLPAPTGSETNVITTASPIFTISGGNAGAIVTLTGVGSTDPQFDTIVIWRSPDGGNSSDMFELTEIPSPPPINGVAQPWSFVDFLPDTPTNLYPGLDPLIPAPINDSNDPPPSTFLPMVYNFERIWGGNGQFAEFSGGPDVLTGNPNEAFNPIDTLPFLANVVRLVKVPSGLVTFLTDSIEFIAGGPSTASFFSITLAPGTGLSSYNALDQFAGEIYFFSSDNRLVLLSPTLNMSNSGFPLGDQFANIPSSGVSDTTWDPAKVYVSILQNGIDNCLIISDGSTGWYRQNPHQVPGGAQGVEPIWSPYATITNGCKMVQTVETSPGIKKLLVGATTGGKKILYRNQSVFTDDGISYGANFVMGSITLAHPGQIAVLRFLEMDFSGVSYKPTVSFLLNELSGTFTPFILNPVFDPPQLYGTTIVPKTYSPNRYYFSGTGALSRCRHMQIKVDFGTTPNGDELFDMTIFGRILVEG